MSTSSTIKSIDSNSIHRITSGQVVIDLQTAVKELVENSLDAGATSIEVRFKQYGLKSIEVIDNGCGIDSGDYDSIALKHHTSKLSSFSDLSTVRTFGFRGEALSSLCAVCETVVLTTTTEPPMGVSLELDASGHVRKQGKIARQRGTTITLTNLFTTLPVRRKEFERNAKREFGKALGLLNAYALGPCCTSKGQSGKEKDDGEAAGVGVRLTVSNQVDKGQRQNALRTPGTSARASVISLWGPKALDNLVDLDLHFLVERDRSAFKRRGDKGKGEDGGGDVKTPVVVKGLVSKFALGCGRTGTDRQFFYVNGRPCGLGKVQKAFNEVYRSFNATQSPFVVADFIIPTESCDINVSPDKRTIFLHSEGNLIASLKAALEESFAPSRATYDVGTTHSKPNTQSTLSGTRTLTMSRAKNVNADAKGKDSDVHIIRDGGDCDVLSGEDGDGDVPGSEGGGRTRRGQSKSAATRPRQSRMPGSTPQPELEPEPARSTSPLDMILGFDVDPHGPSASSSMTLVPDDDADESSEEGSRSTQRRKLVGGRSGAARDMDVDFEPSLIDSTTDSTTTNAPTPIFRGSTPTIAQSRIKEVAKVMDTTRAAWNRGRDVRRSVEVDERVSKEEGPPKKKRCSDIGGVGVEEEDVEVVPQNTKGEVEAGKRTGKRREGKGSAPPTGKEPRQILRNRLVGFTRSGSQVVAVDLEEGVDSVPPNDSDGEVDKEFAAKQEQENGEGRKGRRFRGDVGDDMLHDEDVGTVRQDEETDTPMNIDAEESGDTSMADTATGDPNVIDLADDDMHDSQDIFMLNTDTSISTTPSYEEIVTRPEVIRSSDGRNGHVSLRFDLSRISATWRQLRDMPSSVPTVPNPDRCSAVPKIPLDAGVSNTDSDDKAVDALARVIEKEDFASMDIVGQFNLGFIVARRRKPISGNEEQDGEIRGEMMDDLFIVDQHAADEKYNFENLQQTTSIKSQKLFRPQPLELTAADELLALENIDVLRQNGFEIDANQDGDVASGQDRRLKLVAQPVSKSTVFDMKDLEELIHLMHDRPTGQMVRCSKARAMFAMRACRKSVMVGMPLAKNQMRSVVQHMGTMDQPWNCPHGRPTMRHLSDIASTRLDKHLRKIDWSAFDLT